MTYDNMIINHCPHCGGKGKIKGRKKHKVVCTKCGAQGAEKPLASQAVASWNQENIIKCKDCRHYDEEFFLCRRHQDVSAYYEDDYCSKAIRKDENHNG